MALGKVAMFSILVAFLAAFYRLDYFQSSRVELDKAIRQIIKQYFGPKEIPHEERTAVGSFNIVRESLTEYVMTKEELLEYDGSKGSKGLYLAIMGQVFDVSRGERHYGPGGGYEFFSGKDGSRAFVTGEFNVKGLVDDLEGLQLGQMGELEDWVKFYHKDYTYVGKLAGTFYDIDGRPTEKLREAQEIIDQNTLEQKKKADHKKLFPPCNSRWNQQDGAVVWCTEKSGGIQREWVGVPRRWKDANSPHTRCVCVRTTGPPSDDPDAITDRGDLDNPHLKEYEECEPDSVECPVPR